MNLENKVLKKDGQCWVGMVIKKEEADELYPQILKIRDKIYDEVSIPLEWKSPEDGRGVASIGIVKDSVNFDDPSEAEQAIIWMAENGVEIYNAFLPYFEELKFSK